VPHVGYTLYPITVVLFFFRLRHTAADQSLVRCIFIAFTYYSHNYWSTGFWRASVLL